MLTIPKVLGARNHPTANLTTAVVDCGEGEVA